MPRSEIDEIFASALSLKKKKIKTLDSSKKKIPAKRRREKKHAGDGFQDSRGSASRRKTAEGYNIYKEDELGISNTGGDTPLCPFDCQCCF